MYLMGDEKLWWRTRVREDSEAGRLQVAEWETLKKELKDWFLSTNPGWLARGSLKRLKHTNFNAGLCERVQFLDVEHKEHVR